MEAGTSRSLHKWNGSFQKVVHRGGERLDKASGLGVLDFIGGFMA